MFSLIFKPTVRRHRMRGVTLIEVLVTIVILAFGLIGLAGMQSKFTMGTLESYQRAQAVILLNEMIERMNANRSNADSYASNSAILGNGHTDPSDCSTVVPTGTQNALAARDLCEWSNALKGMSVTSASNANTGAMMGAHGCITRVQAPSTVTGSCLPGIYQVVVEWQGVHQTKAPSVQCTSGTSDGYRRAISSLITVAQTSCQGNAGG